MRAAVKARGFTLLEVLVAIALAGVLLGTLMNFLTSTNNAAAQAAQAAQALREIQMGGAILADDVRLARVIYPAAQFLTLNSAYPATVRNPETGTNVWETKSTGSFVAMVLPSDAGQPCATTGLEFVAYYLIPRVNLTSLPLTDWGNPGPDPANDDTNVLMRYSTCVSTVAPLPTNLSGGEGRLVIDYLESAGMNITSSQVTATMVGTRTVGGREVRVPAVGASPSVISVSATSRNRK